MNERIQSWASMLLGAGVIALAGWLAIEQMSRTRVRAEIGDGGASGSAGAAGGAVDSGTGTGAGAGTDPTDGGAGTDVGDGGLSLSGLSALLDGGAMPTGAPRSVRLGVVLVQFAGAEGASSAARAKRDALEHAVELAAQAKTDWKAAVKAGDSGSSEDIGRIPRGVLDRATELAVFSLEKDALSEPLETPRGYWIVKRIE